MEGTFSSGAMVGSVGAGDVIAGKYRVERFIASGGMGVVVAATHLQLGIRVALKFLSPEASQSPEASARFAREARAAAMIRSEHVGRVMDVGKLESGTPYLVMEYLEGMDLSALLEANGPVSVEDAVGYVLQAGEAIAEAHALGVVHRDLKPSNLFLATRPDGSHVIKVLDFGISKISADTQRAEPSITATRGMMGSPTYMAPEQIRSARDVDPRADLWALGLVLYELLAGAPAFEAETAPALFAKIVLEPPAALSSRRSLPAGLEAVITRCLEKDRALRISSVQQLASALEPFASEEGRRSVARILRTAPERQLASGLTVSIVDEARLMPSTPPPTFAGWGRTTPRPLGKRRSLLIVAALSLIVAVLVLVQHVSNKSSPPASNASVGVATQTAPLPHSPSARVADRAPPTPPPAAANAEPSALVNQTSQVATNEHQKTPLPAPQRAHREAKGVARGSSARVSREDQLFDGTQ